MPHLCTGDKMPCTAYTIIMVTSVTSALFSIVAFYIVKIYLLICLFCSEHENSQISVRQTGRNSKAKKH